MHQCNLAVMTEGAADAALLLVAQSPGADEVREGRPLIGLSGKILWKHAGQYGIHREAVMILNACCQIPDGGPSQAAPTRAQMAECAPEFERLLASFRGRVILTMGAPALEAVMGTKYSVDKMRGYLLNASDVGGVKSKVEVVVGEYKTSKKCPTCKGTGLQYHGVYVCDDCLRTGYRYRTGDLKKKWQSVLVPRPLPSSVEWVIPTMHPASVHYALYKTLPAFRADLARAADASTVGVAPLPIEFDQQARWLPGAFSFDFETTPAWDQITEIGIANAREAWTSLWVGEAIAATRQMLTQKGTLKIAHNMAFDYERALEDGIEIEGPFFDTMLAFAMLQPDLFKALEKVATIYHPLRPWKHLSKSQQSLYNATDAVVTFALHEPLREDLAYTGMLPLFENVIMPALPTLVHMKRNGLYVSAERLVAWQAKLQSEELDLAEEWEDLVEPYGQHVNPHSTKDVQTFLYGRLSLPVQRSKFKRVTVDDNALTKLLGRGKDEIITCLKRLRKVSKLRRTYSKVNLGADHSVHPGYLPRNKDFDEGAAKGFAASGRLASSNPNIQNQPKEARLLFVPRQGYVYVQADWKAAEVRVVATVSHDIKLHEALASGDVHERTRLALGCDRVRAKNVLFGTIYGAGPKTLADLLTRHGAPTTAKEAAALQRGLAREYRDLWRWRERIVHDGQTDGFITNPFGRRRYFYWPSEQAPEMIDFIPQSTVADCLWSVLKHLDEWATTGGARLVASVHDSVLFEIPEGTHMGDVRQDLREIMEQEWPQVGPGFRIPIELEWSPDSWGEMRKWEPEW